MLSSTASPLAGTCWRSAASSATSPGRACSRSNRPGECDPGGSVHLHRGRSGPGRTLVVLGILVLDEPGPANDAAASRANLDLVALDERVEDLLEIVRVPVHILLQGLASGAVPLRLKFIEGIQEGSAVVTDVSDAATTTTAAHED